MTDERHPDRGAGEPTSSEGQPSPRGDELASDHHPDTDHEAEEQARKARSSRPVRKKKAAAAQASEDRSAADESPSASESAGAGGAPAEDSIEHIPSRSLTQAPVRRRHPDEDDSEEGGHRRTTPLVFVRQSVGELKKVRWPTGAETGQYFIVVLVFVLVIIGYVGGLDALFAKALLDLFG